MKNKIQKIKDFVEVQKNRKKPVMQVITEKRRFCNCCKKVFDWNPATSWYFGALEYNSVSKESQIARWYCSDECKIKSETFNRKTKIMKVATVCSGIGSPEMALQNLGIDHTISFACEIDKYARQTYLANYDPKMMLEDMTAHDWKGEEFNADLFIGGIPCQSFSLAGKRLGELDKRGLLFYDFYKYVKEQQPKYFIIENVKGLLSDAKGRTFQNWQDLLGRSVNGTDFLFPLEDSLMYNLHWEVLNTKNYELPQNRERVFLIGIRSDLKNNFVFPREMPLHLRLRDMLETEVEEKYYLSEKMLEYFTTRAANFNNGKVNFKTGDDIASCINASSKSLDISDNIIKEVKFNGQFEPKEGDDIANCLTSRYYKMGATDNYMKVPQEPIHSKSKVAHTLSGGKWDKLHDQSRRVFDTNYISPTIHTSGGGQQEIKIATGYRIRKLTPLECFRLQGFPDNFKKPVSNSQLYKQAGNSISVTVIQAILKNLLKNEL